MFCRRCAQQSEEKMTRDCKKALAQIAKVCRENIAAFGPTYDPHWGSETNPGPPMQGAKAEANGVTDMAREILTEIRLLRRAHRRANRQVHTHV
jgi:hypothetical protein